MMIDVTQEDRQYWKATVPVKRVGGEPVLLEITIAPEGMTIDAVEDGEFVGNSRWETWDEIAATVTDGVGV